VTDVSLATLKKFYEAGWSLADISRMTGVPKSTVYGRLLSMNVRMRRRGQHNHVLSENAISQTVELYVSGLSYRQVAEILGIDKSTARDRIPEEYRRTRQQGIRYFFSNHNMADVRPARAKHEMHEDPIPVARSGDHLLQGDEA
jgi:transposase